jgi:hypothetical protein
VTTDEGGLIESSRHYPTKEAAWVALARWTVDHRDKSAAVIEADTGELYTISPLNACSVLVDELQKAQQRHAHHPELMEREDALLIAYRYALQAEDPHHEATIGRLASMENEELPLKERHRLLAEAMAYDPLPLVRGRARQGDLLTMAREYRFNAQAYRAGMRTGLPRLHIDNPYGRPLVPIHDLHAWRDRIAQRLGIDLSAPAEKRCGDCFAWGDGRCHETGKRAGFNATACRHWEYRSP